MTSALLSLPHILMLLLTLASHWLLSVQRTLWLSRYAAGFKWCATEEEVEAAAQGNGGMGRPSWPVGLSHQSFLSPSMNELVGYCIYLPPDYTASAPDWRSPRLNGGDRRYPVVYYLHGGRPGNELAGAGMASYIASAMEARTVPPAIYVFVNGGPLSHYNYPHDTSCVSAAQLLAWNFSRHGDTQILLIYCDCCWRNLQIWQHGEAGNGV